jgi:hypothetical protein
MKTRPYTVVLTGILLVAFLSGGTQATFSPPRRF